MTSARLARAGAILIALAAAFDPGFVRDRAVPVPVAILHQPEDSSFAAEIRRALSPAFTIVDGPSPEAEAAVVIALHGAPLPRLHDGARVFVIEPTSLDAALRVHAFEVPHTTAPGRIVTANVAVDAYGLTGQTMTLSLYASERLVARETRAIDGELARVTAGMSFVPVTEGLTPLRLDVSAGRVSARAGAATVADNRVLRVLFVGSRPSWSATFIRRALEQDPAFRVSSSIGTSRGVASTTEDAPGLGDANAREHFDVVIAGAPSALTEPAMRELEAFARVRGGSVVLLADAGSERVLERLTSLGGWTRRTHADPLTARSPHGVVRFSESLIPAAGPIPATVLAETPADSRGIVTQVPLGAGRVIVSGALDDWRHRVDPQASYERFWKGVIADAALASAPPLSLRVTPLSAGPAGTITIEAAMRDARAGDTASVEASMETPGRPARSVRLWPSATPGVFTGRAVAPSASGASRLVVAVRAADGELRAEATFFVGADSSPAASTPAGAAAILASTHGGADVGSGGIAELQRALAQAFPAHRAPATIRPMRYAWWLLPFTALLGYEWRWRRQRGLK